jgi:hypothetical protein
VHAGFARRATVGRAFGSAVRATIGAAVVHARFTGSAAIRRPLGPAIGATVVHARRSRRAAVRRTFGSGDRRVIIKHSRTPHYRMTPDIEKCPAQKWDAHVGMPQNTLRSFAVSRAIASNVATMLASDLVPTDDLVRVRRHLHRHPELSMVEHETASFVTHELEKLGLDEIRTAVGRTGVLGTLCGGKPGPVTLLRADMDALPIAELVDADYRSQKNGVMHACGHDGHVSILLAAARTLAARRAEIPGTLVFCFQPGEEGSAGNRLMIEDGALENPHVDRTFALHLYSGLDVGKIGVRDGAFFASADEYTLIIKGKGGHGAMPQIAIDPIDRGFVFRDDAPNDREPRDRGEGSRGLYGR